jgi:hypothetical protein
MGSEATAAGHAPAGSALSGDEGVLGCTRTPSHEHTDGLSSGADWDEYALSPLGGTSSEAASVAETTSPGASNDSATRVLQEDASAAASRTLQQVPELFDSVETATSDLSEIQRAHCEVLVEEEEDASEKEPENRSAAAGAHSHSPRAAAVWDEGHKNDQTCSVSESSHTVLGSIFRPTAATLAGRALFTMSPRGMTCP